MERGKLGHGRGGKSKLPHHPADLIALGAKSSRSEIADTKRPPVLPKPGSSHATLQGQDRKRDLPPGTSSGLPAKKPKVEASSSSLHPARSGPNSPAHTAASSDSWELVAVECEASELVLSVSRAMEIEDTNKAKAYICGAIKQLRAQRAKPDKVLYLGLMYLATVMPYLFNSEHVVQALCSLLRRDPTLNFKSKGNPVVSALAASLLFKGFQDHKHWPTDFIKVYVDDSIGERVWVDMEETRGFVDNLVTGFNTRPTNRALLPADFLAGPGARSDSPSTVSSATNTDDEGEGEGTAGAAGSSKPKMETIPTMPRYRDNTDAVEALVMEAVREQLTRRQPPETVSRNLLRLLATASGLGEVRLTAAPRLELWLQNPKLMRVAQELLLAVCANCTSPSTQRDVDIITHVMKIRFKTKAITNLYLSGIKELLAAHSDNLALVMKITIYNELSNARNPNNMAVINVMFQSVPEPSSNVLAEIFQELLMNREDLLRPLRGLLREVVRQLRHDIPFAILCRALMKDRSRDPAVREFQPKERLLAAIADLVSLCVLLAVSPSVREAASLLARGDRREVQTLYNFRQLVAKIQRDAVWWLQETVPRMYHPSTQDFNHTLLKVLFLEPVEQYHGKDNWPGENERGLMMRLASEVPVLQNTLVRLTMLGVSKEHPITGLDLLDVMDRVVRRAAAIQAEGTAAPLQVDKTDLFELIFNLCAYRHPENITLPKGYFPPQLAVAAGYWKSWIILLILAAHNPELFGNIAWEKYPTLRALMEMCITNHFVFPPPTMALLDEETKEIQLAAMERQQILEFETHLAAASTKVTITEQNSLLLSQLTSLDPTGPARRPSLATLALLKTYNEQLHLGHRLCRSRRPDFLLDVIQRQGASQAMPWLADLVESSEGALSHLPVQCLCEFLLSESSLEGDSSTSSSTAEGAAAAQQRHVKQRQLVVHLRSVLQDTEAPDAAAQCCEVLDYFLRRLGTAQASSRTLAIKGLRMLLQPGDDEEEDQSTPHAPHAWLLQQLPSLPHFSAARPQAVIALRQACQVENELSNVRAYLTFLATHAVSDSLPELQDLVLDMAQLIVERNTIMAALLPGTEFNDPSSCGESAVLAAQAAGTQHALMRMFTAYLQAAREPRKEAYTWSESQDQILVTWSTGEESTMHILVVHAMIILLTFGPGQDPQLFSELMETWVPANKEPPKAFLVDTSEEALLIPDWLKLKMIQSSAPGLVDAALSDLDPQQLLLFVQSFGIPPANMSKLLSLLDRAVDVDLEVVRESVQDKTYMRQLVEVQHYRGATGGHRFLEFLSEPSSVPPPTPSLSSGATLGVRPPIPSTAAPPRLSVRPEEVPWLLGQIFDPQVGVGMETATAAFSRLHRALTRELQDFRATTGVSLPLLSSFLTSASSSALPLLQRAPQFSCPLLRLALTLPRPPRGPAHLHTLLLQLARQLTAQQGAPLAEMLRGFVERRGAEKRRLSVTASDDMAVLHTEAQAGALEPAKARQLVERATQMLLEQDKSLMERSPANTGLLLDWLSCLEPEMVGSCPALQMRLLFSRARGPATACRPYLLTLLTHRTSWGTLHACMTRLLTACDTTYNPGAVLDFLWALIGNPKLWQGREKRTPKHHTPEDILQLSTQQLCVLLDYMVEEALGLGLPQLGGESSGVPLLSSGRQREMLEARVPLLLQCLRPETLLSCVKHLAPAMMAREGPRSRVSRLLLLQLYLSVPALAQHLEEGEREAMLAGAAVPSRGGCSLDTTSHCLLSALAAAPGQGKDWARRAQEFELAARKMAATHPVLVLRQLPMLAASLKGRVHLESSVFRARSHMLLFTQTLGLLELLQPHIFQTEYAQPLEDTLDCFFAMFQRHGHLKDVQASLSRSVTLLQSFVSHDAQRALKYLQRHCQLLHELQANHPSLGLQSLLAGLSLPARDGDEPELLVAAAMGPPAEPQSAAWAQSQVALLLPRLLRHSQGEDVQGALQDLDHVSHRRPSVLEACTDALASLLLAPSGGVRSLAHLLLLRLLRHAPGSAAACVPAYLRSLDSNNPDIQASALERLPDVIVCAQEHALLLLERLFRLGVRSGVHTAPHIARAVALLQLQSGC